MYFNERPPSILVCFSWPGAGVSRYRGARGRSNILKVLKATGPGQVSSPKGERPGSDRHSQKLLDRGRCLPRKGSVRGWINILKSYWTGAGVFPERGASEVG